MFQFPPNPTVGQQYAPTQGVTYEWNGTGWIHLGISTASLYPAGIILPYAGAATAPLPFQGWLLCNGASYSTTAQAVLFAVIGYTYGGSGSNFNVPDLRGRVIAGVDAGTGRLSGGTLAAGLGAESVTLTAAQAPSHAHGISDVVHSHGVNDGGHSHGVSDPGHAHGAGVNDPGHSHQYEPSGTSGHFEFGKQGPGPNGVWRFNANTSHQGTGISVSIAGSGTNVSVQGSGANVSIQGSGTGLSATGAAGGGQAHANVQPTLCLNFIIKA